MQRYFSIYDACCSRDVDEERNIGEVQLKIDCQRMAPSAIDELHEVLCRFLGNVFLVGGDLILASGKIHTRDYANVWNILQRYDVTVE